MSLRPLGAPRGFPPGSKPSPPRERPSAYAAALRRLALRDRSESEIRSHLARRGYEEGEVDETLERLRDLGLVNDSRVAERVALSRMESSGLGSYRVRIELERRGFPRESGEAAVRRALEELSEPELLDRAALRYWRANARIPVQKRLRRLHDFLLRRGFPASLVGERLRALWPELREVLPEEHP